MDLVELAVALVHTTSPQFSVIFVTVNVSISPSINIASFPNTDQFTRPPLPSSIVKLTTRVT